MRLRPTALALLLAAAPPAVPADRSHPPSPGPARTLTLPSVQRVTLSNGLPLLLAEAHEVPVAEVVLLVRSGATADPADRPGVSEMTADMLDEGAAGKNALELADAFDYLGAELTTESGWDASSVSLHVPVARLAEALPLMADVVLRPDFPAAELERLRKETLTSLLQARDEPQQIAHWAVDQAVFGPAHRYGRPESGDARSISAVRVEDLRAFHQRHYRPANAVLVVVGDVTPALVPRLESAFGAWRGGEGAPLAVPTPRPLQARTLWLVDKPGAAQSLLRVGRVGPPRLTKEFHELEVMNTLLGGSFTSRLNDNLRETHGYAYGAGSVFRYHRVGGQFLAFSDVQTDATAPALAELLKELQRIRTPPTTAEVERARNYLALSYAWEFETTRQIATKLAQRVAFDLPEDVFSTYVPKILAVGGTQIQQAARGWVDPDRAAVVVVGDRARVEAPLRALQLGTWRVLSVDDVMGAPPQVE
jgi:predicted Zn-dependent peptidase